MDKKLYYTGIWAYPVLLVLAVVFYKERTILLDNSLILFEMLRTGDFTKGQRFIAIVPQTLPLLASKLSLSLKWVMVSYSAGFIIYHFVCYLLCGVLKNYRLGIALLLVNLLIVSHTFFWHLSELLLGISLIFPFFALLTDTERKLPRLLLYTLLAAGTVTIAFSHPLIAFPFLFVSVFIWLSKEVRVNRLSLVIVNVLFIATILLKKTFLSNPYESENLQLLKNFKTLFPDYLSLYSNTHFVATWFSMYYWLPIVLTIIVVMYVRNRNWLKLLLVLFAFVGYTQIVNVSYPTYHTQEFYKESMYTVLCVFLALPLVYDIFPKWNKAMTLFIFVCILITSFVRINIERDFYANRLSWYRGYLDKYGDEKAIVSFDTVPKGTVLQPWASPYEFWLLSTLERNKTASIVLHKNVDELAWTWENYRAFVTTWGVYPYKDLNPVYFKLTDTSRHYSIYKER